MRSDGVYAEIYSRLAQDPSLFPALPATALRLREAMESPNSDVATLARLIKVDAALAAFIMRAASRVRYLTRITPQDLEDAVRRIGLRDTCHFAFAFLSRAAFGTAVPGLRDYLARVYRSATRTAVLSSFLAGTLRGFSGGRALLAGLLQDIGVAPVLVCLAERQRLPACDEERERLLDELAPLVGVLVLRHWELGEDLLEVARSRKQWLRDSGAQADLADIVLIARLHAAMGTPQFSRCPALTQLPAFAKLSLGELTPHNSLQLVEDARDELAATQRLLCGAR